MFLLLSLTYKDAINKRRYCHSLTDYKSFSGSLVSATERTVFQVSTCEQTKEMLRVLFQIRLDQSKFFSNSLIPLFFIFLAFGFYSWKWIVKPFVVGNPQKLIPFSQSEIEAAKQLIQLSSGDSEEDHHSSNSNNSCSYSVVQGKPPYQSKVDSGGDVSSVATTTAESEDESFARKNKRYRSIKDLYSVTTPVVKAKRKRNKCVGTRK
ncbi:hypothetical protein GmHk_05G013537 [Glycine max]|nr:hypothetical protein GmHk_05G013537 [Glycine max]